MSVNDDTIKKLVDYVYYELGTRKGLDNVFDNMGDEIYYGIQNVLAENFKKILDDEKEGKA